MKATPNDHAGIDYWDGLYNSKHQDFSFKPWKPTHYHDMVISGFIEKLIKTNNPSNILEIGCGDSTWLGYLSKKYSLNAFGIDYSEEGCNLARQRLAAEKVNGKIICCNMFEKYESLETQFDLVYSLGVVEHFNNTPDVINQLKYFLSPNGLLITIIPNLFSVHGLLSKIWHPEILDKHVIIKKNELTKAYKLNSLKYITTEYGGTFSLCITQWENCTRWPYVGKILSPSIRKLNNNIHTLLNRLGWYKGSLFFAPYICIAGNNDDKLSIR